MLALCPYEVNAGLVKGGQPTGSFTEDCFTMKTMKYIKASKHGHFGLRSAGITINFKFFMNFMVEAVFYTFGG